MTRAHLTAAAQRRPTVALAFCLAVLSIQSSFFATPGAPGRRLDLDADDVRELAGFQSRVQQCVTEVGVTLTAPTGKERAEGWAGLRGVRELTGIPQGCSDIMSQSLFVVGEIGGNDYNLPMLSRVSIQKIRSFTPSVIAKISSTITELIGLGAKTLVVPGNLPIGCVPKYLLIFKSDDKEQYEPETGCLRWMNEFSEYHNKLLLEELEKLRKINPTMTIIYADYYAAAMEIFHSPE